MIEIIPGVGPLADWSVIEDRLRLVVPLASWAQVDFCDNTLVPNTTHLDFSTFSDIAKEISLEAHLMVANPEKYIRPAVDAGFKRIIAHVESADPRLFLEQVQFEHVEIGMAIDGPTEFEQLEPYLEEVDFVLVMMVEGGFSGQTFLPECVEKIKSIHSYLPDLPIEVEGGITDKTGPIVKEAGASRLVPVNFLFENPANISSAISSLKNV